MKELNQYIQEKLIVNNTIQDHINYKYHPKDKDELIECIKEKIKKEEFGVADNPLDLNDIDTSKITDMRNLFNSLDGKLKDLSKNGNFDISSQNVSNVENMNNMFYHSEFNGNITAWDVSNVKNMYAMFAWSKFNCDISSWDVSNVKNMYAMFYNCPLENNLPKWYKK